MTVGKHGDEERNSRGTGLLEFAFQRNLYIMHTFLEKSANRKWIWSGPDDNIEKQKRLHNYRPRRDSGGTDFQ